SYLLPCTAAHRALHSFPTRRSSDLAMVRQMVGREVRVAHCGGNAAGGLGTDVAAIKHCIEQVYGPKGVAVLVDLGGAETNSEMRSEEHTSELQSQSNLVCRLLLEKK